MNELLADKNVTDSARNSKQAQWLWRVTTRTKRRGRGILPRVLERRNPSEINELQHNKWRRRESNPRPVIPQFRPLRA